MTSRYEPPKPIKMGITFRDVIQSGFLLLEVRCRKCPRTGRISVRRMITQYGIDAYIWAHNDAMIGECERKKHVQLWERCSLYWPDLTELRL